MLCLLLHHRPSNERPLLGSGDRLTAPYQVLTVTQRLYPPPGGGGGVHYAARRAGKLTTSAFCCCCCCPPIPGLCRNLHLHVVLMRTSHRGQTSKWLTAASAHHSYARTRPYGKSSSKGAVCVFLYGLFGKLNPSHSRTAI